MKVIRLVILFPRSQGRSTSFVSLSSPIPYGHCDSHCNVKLGDHSINFISFKSGLLQFNFEFLSFFNFYTYSPGHRDDQLPNVSEQRKKGKSLAIFHSLFTSYSSFFLIPEEITSPSRNKKKEIRSQGLIINTSRVSTSHYTISLLILHITITLQL